MAQVHVPFHPLARCVVLLCGILGGSAALAQAAAKADPIPPPSLVLAQRCIPVDGTTFELAGSEHLLAKKGNTSVALVRLSMFLPAGLSSMRFSAGELCALGPKANFVINDLQYTVSSIRLIDGDAKVRVAKIDPTGTAATVTGPSN
jgi:hypothetical protein